MRTVEGGEGEKWGEECVRGKEGMGGRKGCEERERNGGCVCGCGVGDMCMW